MTIAAVNALQADFEALSEMASRFTSTDWSTPSPCEGWTVGDVVAHLTQLFRQVVDPGSLPPRDPSGSSERTQDRWVEVMRPMAQEEVVEQYVTLGRAAIARLRAIQEVTDPIDLGDLGTHPTHLVADAFAFDHYTHIRADLCAPRGPLDMPAPPSNDHQLGPVIGWMVTAIPQMNAAELGWLDTRVELELRGPGGRRASFGGRRGDVVTISSSTADFVLWGTKREDWRDLDVRIEGDAVVGRRFCDAVRAF